MNLLVFLQREFCNFVYRYSSIHAGPYDANPDYIDKMPKDFLGNVRRLIYVFTEMEYLDASYRQLQLVVKLQFSNVLLAINLIFFVLRFTDI